MAMVQRDLMAGMEGEPIVFECFNSLDAIRKSFGPSNMLRIEARRLNETVEQDLERIGLLSVIQEGGGKKDVGKLRRKKTGLVDEELSRQPSKGKIYGRKVNGRFASKAIYNYHHKKKTQGFVDEDKSEFIDDSQCSDDGYSRKIKKEDEKKDFVTLKNISSVTKSKHDVMVGQQSNNTPNIPTSKQLTLSSLEASNDQEKKRRAKKACEGGMVLLNEMFVVRALKAFENSSSDLPLPVVQKTKEKNFPLTSDDEIVSKMSEVKADDQTEYDADANLPALPLPLALSQCPILHCRLGCICDSLKVRPQNIKPTHCGNHHCMLSCQCQHMTRARASKLAATDMFECPLSPRMKLNVARSSEDVANSAVVHARRVVQSVVKKRTAEVANISSRNKKSNTSLEISSESEADEAHKRFKADPAKESRRSSLQPTDQSCARTSEAYRKQNIPLKTLQNNNTNNQNKNGNQCRKPVMYLVRKKMNLNGKCMEKTLLIEAYSQCQWSNYKRRLSSVLFECVFVRNLLKSGPYVLKFEQFKLRVMKQDPGKNGVLNNININNIVIDNVNTAYIKVFIYLINNQPPHTIQGSDPIIIPDSPTNTDSACEVKDEGETQDEDKYKQENEVEVNKDKIKKEDDDEGEMRGVIGRDGNTVKLDGLMGSRSDLCANGDVVGVVSDDEVKSKLERDSKFKNKIQSNNIEENDKIINHKHNLGETMQKEASTLEIVNKNTHLEQKDVKKEMKEANKILDDDVRKKDGEDNVDEPTTTTTIINSTTTTVTTVSTTTTTTTVPISTTTTTNSLTEEYLTCSESPECSFDDSDPPLIIDTSVKTSSSSFSDIRPKGDVGGAFKNSCKSSVFNLNASNKYKCQLSIYINEDDSPQKKSSPRRNNGCPSSGASSVPKEFVSLHNPNSKKPELPIDLSNKASVKHVRKTIVISKTPLSQLNSIPFKPTITISNTSPTKSIVNFPKPPISKSIVSLPFTSISPPKPLLPSPKTNSSINNVVNVSPKTLVSINMPIIHLSKPVLSANPTSNISKIMPTNTTISCNTNTTSPVALKPNQASKNIVPLKVLNITVSPENDALKKSISAKLSPNISSSQTKLSPNTSPTIIVKKMVPTSGSKTSPSQQPNSSLVMRIINPLKDDDNNENINNINRDNISIKSNNDSKNNNNNNNDDKHRVTCSAFENNEI